MRDNLPLTSPGKLKKASASEIFHWVASAWNKVPGKMIEKSFKKCSISNSMDGTEDDVLWEHSEDEDDPDDRISSSEDDESDSNSEEDYY